MTEFPKWLSPHADHRLLRNSSGELEHTSNLQFHRDRVTQQTKVLCANATEEKVALAPPNIEFEKAAEVVGDVSVSLDDLAADLTRVTTQYPGLFGPAIEELVENVQEVGSLAARKVALLREIKDLEAKAAKLRDVGPEYDALRKKFA
jgi:argininosuccinate lyase